MKHNRLFVLFLALAVLALATVACGGTNLAPEATGLRYVQGPNGIESVPQLVISLDEQGTPSAMGITPAAVEGALAQFGMTLGDVNAYAVPTQVINVFETENVEHLQLVVRQLANGRFIFLLVNGEEMLRLSWAARSILISSIEVSGSVPADMLALITQGLDALEAAGDMDLDFGITTHLYNTAKAAGTATELVWPPTQGEIDAEAAASAAATATAYPTATPTQTPLEIELIAAATPSAPNTPWEGVELSGYYFSPLAYEGGDKAAIRLSTQGFDRECLSVYFAAVIEVDEADNGRWDWWRTSFDIPLPAVCLAN